MNISKSIPFISTVWKAKPVQAKLFNFGARYRHSGLTLLNDFPVTLDTPWSRMVRDHDTMLERMFANPMRNAVQQLNQQNSFVDSPRFEIKNTEKDIKIALDVPGVNQEDIDVEFDNDSRMLSISGSRESKGDGYLFSSKFSRSFTVDPGVNIDKFTAQLNDGVLVITAPKDIVKNEETVRKIPIVTQTTSDGESVSEGESPVDF